MHKGLLRIETKPLRLVRPEDPILRSPQPGVLGSPTPAHVRVRWATLQHSFAHCAIRGSADVAERI